VRGSSLPGRSVTDREVKQDIDKTDNVSETNHQEKRRAEGSGGEKNNIGNRNSGCLVSVACVLLARLIYTVSQKNDTKKRH